MWTTTTMTIPESLLVSLMGFSIVFGILVFLALVILVFAKVLPALTANKKPAAAAAPAAKPAAAPARPAAPVVVEDKSETVAIITSVICEELLADPNELVITNIVER